MKKILSASTVALLLASTSIAYADAMEVDPSKLDAATLAAVLKQSADKKPEQKVEEWAGIGKEIAGAVKDTAAGLSVQANEFIKTPVGEIAMLIIFWKIIGEALVSCLLLMLLGLTGLAFTWKSFKYFLCKSEYKFHSDDARIGCTCLHIIAFGMFTLMLFIAALNI